MVVKTRSVAERTGAGLEPFGAANLAGEQIFADQLLQWTLEGKCFTASPEYEVDSDTGSTDHNDTVHDYALMSDEIDMANAEFTLFTHYGGVDKLYNKIIPENFETPEEAGKFWDTHSAADYWNDMEEVEMDFDIKKRIYQIPLDERIYRVARKRAETEHSTVRKVIQTVLERAFSLTEQLYEGDGTMVAFAVANSYQPAAISHVEGTAIFIFRQDNQDINNVRKSC